MKLKRLMNKFMRVCREDGFWTAIGRVLHFAGNVEGRRERRQDIRNARKTKGRVLFINGYGVEHPIRYRVLHQMEQLEVAGVNCAKIYFEDIDLRMESNFQMFIFYRCECTENIKEFITLAKKHYKKVCFDIDDLVFDTKYTDQVPFVQEMPFETKKIFDAIVMRTRETLEQCDVAITTTEALAKELEKVVPETYINRNTASKEMVICSERAYESCKCDSSNLIWLGYFSGSLTHNKDFEIVRPALMKIMEKYSQTGLMLVGELDVSDELKRFSDRIVKLEAVGWRELPKVIAQADINLAPLEDTIFNHSKSEIKWIEAALVRVPTVASNIGAFHNMIEDGVTGILCENTESAWMEGIGRLIDDEVLKRQISIQSYDFVMKNCTTIEKSQSYADFINYHML